MVAQCLHNGDLKDSREPTYIKVTDPSKHSDGENFSKLDEIHTVSSADTY
jgi:hypothetical protein